MHRRDAADRRSARRLGRADRARLAAAPAGGDERHHRRQAAEQLADNIAATEVSLTADELATLDAASRLPPEYPGWMLERQGEYRAAQLSQAPRKKGNS